MNNRQNKPTRINSKVKRLQLFLTDICNLSCRHCYLGAREKRSHSLSLYEADQALRYMSNLGVKKVDLTGGEPTYHPLFPTLIRLAKRYHFSDISVVSNGTNPNLVHSIKKYSRDVTLRFSLDGFKEKTHDFLRGKGVYKKCLRSIKLALKNKFKVEVIYTVHARNLSEVKQTIDFLDKLGVSVISFNVISIMGNAENNKDLAITPKQWLDLRKKIVKSKVKNATLRFPILFATKKEFKSLVDNGYACQLSKPQEYILFADKRVFHCCLLTDTKLNSYLFKDGVLEKNYRQSEKDLYRKFSNSSCMVLERIPEKVGLKENHANLIPVCVYRKMYVKPNVSS